MRRSCSRESAAGYCQLTRPSAPFLTLQNYSDYTAADQDLWRSMLTQLTEQLAGFAHPGYLEGLARTGISLEHIPSIDEMNEYLAQMG
jgi:phenylalanine-4-hydroxylase